MSHDQNDYDDGRWLRESDDGSGGCLGLILLVVVAWVLLGGVVRYFMGLPP